MTMISYSFLAILHFFLSQILNCTGVYRAAPTAWLLSLVHRGWSHGIGGHGLCFHWAFRGMNNVIKLSGKTTTL